MGGVELSFFVYPKVIIWWTETFITYCALYSSSFYKFKLILKRFWYFYERNEDLSEAPKSVEGVSIIYQSSNILVIICWTTI